ncbi:MAG: hypothetical protein ACOCYQ_00665 [Alkalispirochaeta sp.]
MRIICGAMVYGRNETIGCVTGVTVNSVEDRVSGFLVRELNGSRGGCRYLPFEAVQGHDGRHLYTDLTLDRIRPFDEEECAVERARMRHWLDSMVEDPGIDGEDLERRFAVIETDDDGEFPLSTENAIAIDGCGRGRIAHIEVDASGYIEMVVIRTDRSSTDVRAMRPLPKRTRDEVLRHAHALFPQAQ